LEILPPRNGFFEEALTSKARRAADQFIPNLLIRLENSIKWHTAFVNHGNTL
jgi:hypothetical protein